VSLSLHPVNSPALRQARALVGDLTPRQRYGIGGGVLAVVVAMVLFVHFMAKPGYTLLYAGLQPADAQEVTSQLSSLAIPYDISADGASVSVPAGLLDRARLQLAARGLPHSGQLGFEIFDKTNWSGSDFAEQVNYQRALEGELERTIETIHDVQSARVHITLAHDSLFTSEERAAKAAVLLTLRNGSLDPNMAVAIQHLVASAVDHLNPSNVAILDASGQMSLAGQPGQPGQSLDAGGGDRLESELKAKILATLAPVVGASHVRADVTVEYDPSSADNTQETYDPASTAVLTSQRSSAGAAAALDAGVPGTSSNLPAAQAAGTSFNAQLGADAPAAQQTSSETFAVSRSVNHTIRPSGAIQRLTAAVVLDDAEQTITRNGRPSTVMRKRTADELQQIQGLVAAAIGLNPARGDVLTVTNLPFAAPTVLAPEAAPTPAPAPANRWPGLLRWAALALLLLLLPFLAKSLLWHPRPAAARTAATAQLATEAPAEALPQTTATALTPAAASGKPEYINMTELLTADPDDAPAEVQHVLRLKDRLAERVRREPAVASRLVQNWMSKRPEDAS